MQQNDRFFNAYVDLAVGTIHQNVNTILELKTQVKMLEDQVRELDSAVGVMNQRIENFDKEKDSLIKQFEEDTKNLTSQYDRKLSDLQSKLKSLEREKESTLKKSGHMSTFENQIKDMKREILEKNAEIESLKSNTSNTGVTSVINTKTKKSSSKPENVDDF
jgi:chromosome segregation ATPase